MSEKFYVVTRTAEGRVSCYVREEGEPTRILEHVVRHSPTGFEVGYAGSGPSDLALSIMHDAVPPLAERLYQEFKRLVVAPAPRSGFVIAQELVEAWALRRHDEATRQLSLIGGST